MDIFDGFVLVSPGTLSLAVIGAPSVSKDEPRSLSRRGYLSGLAASIGATNARVEFDTIVIKVDSITARDFGGTFDSNLTVQADSGFVSFAVIHTSPPDVDSTDFATVWVTVVGAGGDSTEVKWKLDELSDPVQFSDPLPFIVSNQSLKVGVTPGIWGDATKDQLITAVDALVCLSHVVGKTLPESFDPRARDVAPDAGTRFAGKGTALVALAILSWVVGQALPEHFRVGDSRSAVAGGADSLAPPASTRDIRNSQLGACGMVWSGSLGPAVCQKRRAASHLTVYWGYQ